MWLQVHLWTWAVASVWGAGVVMGVARRPRGEWQDVDTEAREGRPYGSSSSHQHQHPQHPRPPRSHPWRPATNPVYGVVLDASQVGDEEPRSGWSPQWRTSTNGRTSHDGRAYPRAHGSPRARQDAHAVPGAQRGQPTLGTDQGRLKADRLHRFRADATHRFRKATDEREAASRELHTRGDVRGNMAKSQRVDETRYQARRAQGGSRRPRPHTPTDGDLTNRYRVGSEALVTGSRAHRLQPEASETTRRYSGVGEVEEQRSRGPHTRRYYWLVSEAPPRMSSTQSQEQNIRLRYSEVHSAVSRSFPGDSLTSQSDGRSTMSGVHDDHRQGEVHDVTRAGSSTWPAQHTSPVQRSGDSHTSEASSGAYDDLHDTYGTSQAYTPLEDGVERTPLAAPVSQDLHISRHDPPHQDAEIQREAPDWCCGSSVPLDHENAIYIGGLSRVASAGSVKVVAVPSVYTDLYPPFTVRDLRVAPLDLHTVNLTWTAPGDDLDSGTASSYVIRMSDTIRDLKESRFDLAPDVTLLDVADLLTASDVYQTAGTKVSVRVPLAEQLQLGHVYFLALRALDDQDNASPVSNVARFSIPRPLSDAPGGHTTTAEDDHHHHPEDAEHNKSLVRFPEENTSLPAAQDDREEAGPPHGDTRVSLEPTEPSLTAPEPTESNLIVSETTEPPLLVTEPTGSGLRSVSEGNEDLTTGTAGGRDLTVSSSEPDQNHPQRRGRKRKNRKNKKERKAKKNRRDGKKNRRRKDKRRREGREEEERPETEDNSGTYLYENGECHIDEAHEGNISLCDARYSLAIVIAYFEQNADYRHVDYLWAAMNSLNQRTRPPWQREQRSSRRHRRGGRSRASGHADRALAVSSSG